MLPQWLQFRMIQDEIYGWRDTLGADHLWSALCCLEAGIGGGVRNRTFIRPCGPTPVALTQPGASPRRTAPSA